MPLRDDVERYFAKHLNRRPNLDNPRGYNEKVQWLKLFDHMPEHITGCDKLAARDYVAGIIGPGYLLPVFDVAERFEALPYRVPAIVKASHDSGSVARATDRASWAKAGERITRGLARTYGTGNGEWAYARVKPRCFSEELMPDPVIDYKFHCVAGAIKWVQVIAERRSGHPLETITDENAAALGLHLDHQFRHGARPIDFPATWWQMAETARELSKPFRYVRVDLYSSQGRVYFGELTFWPKSGIYKTKDEATFGAMLDFDMSFKRPALA
jgi:TupA-like ATPgrasp